MKLHESGFIVEDRHAKEGERILITGAYGTGGDYEDGDVINVGRGDVYIDGWVMFSQQRNIDPDEYDVIVGHIDDYAMSDMDCTPPKPRTSDIIDHPLVFIQHSDKPGDYTVYQDGIKVEGISEISIFADRAGYTTHEIEYFTGKTKAGRLDER